MAGQDYYLITALPSVGAFGSEPPITQRELMDHVSDVPDARRLVEMVLLEDDLHQRQAFLSGEIDQVEPVVLSAAQARDEETLPEFLTAIEGEPQPLPARSAANFLPPGWASRSPCEIC